MRIVNKELINQIKNLTQELVSTHKGLKENDLMMKILGEVVIAYREDIERAISEAIQEHMIMRIEYQVPDNHTFYQFYLPFGSRTY